MFDIVIIFYRLALNNDISCVFTPLQATNCRKYSQCCIIDKIKKLTQQLKELANSTGSADEKKKQQELERKKAQEAKQKALEKKQAEQARKKSQQEAKQLEDDLFSDLDSDTPGAPGNKAGPGMGGEGDAYSGLVSATIQRNMFIDQNMKGKSAVLKVKIAPDGLIISIGACDGDAAICSAATAALNKIGSLPDPKPFNVTDYDLAINLQL